MPSLQKQSGRTGDQEVVPVGDVEVVFECEGDWDWRGSDGAFDELESSFCRSARSFVGVEPALGEHAIFPRGRPTAGLRDDVVDAGFAGTQHTPRVLALTSIAHPEVFEAEFWAVDGDLGEVSQHDDRGDTNGAAGGTNSSVMRADRQLHPITQFGGIHLFIPFDVQRIGIACAHLGKGIRRRDDRDRLPLTVQDEDAFFMDWIGIHGSTTITLI